MSVCLGGLTRHSHSICNCSLRVIADVQFLHPGWMDPSRHQYLRARRSALGSRLRRLTARRGWATGPCFAVSPCLSSCAASRRLCSVRDNERAAVLTIEAITIMAAKARAMLAKASSGVMLPYSITSAT